MNYVSSVVSLLAGQPERCYTAAIYLSVLVPVEKAAEILSIVREHGAR